MTPLTPANYFELNNGGLSQSKLKDYRIDPNLCYRQNISGELKREKKKAYDIGSAIDDILTEINNLNNYIVLEIPKGEKDSYFMTKAGKAYKQDVIDSGKTVLTRADYDKIVNIADAIIKTDAYTQIAKEYTFQEIIVVPQKIGEHFDCLYGKPDAYKINKDGICDLLDLKTTSTVSERKYFYQFFAFGYDIQLYFYASLLRSKYPQIKGFRYWHLAGEKSEPYLVKLFSIPESYVLGAERKVLETIDKISQDKTFNKYNPSFTSPAIFGQFSDEDYGEWDDEK